MSEQNRDQGDRSIGGGRSKRQRRKERQHQKVRGRRFANRRQTAIRVGIAAVVITGLVVGAVFFVIANSKILPPTSFGPGHSERFPPRQINSSPIPRSIQEHVMERGGGHHRIGSMLIQYNCDRFDCEPDMVAKLRAIVSARPSNVYLAPYPAMDAKIALAAPGRLVILDDLDESRITRFIFDNLGR